MKKLLILLMVLVVTSCADIHYGAITKASNIDECDVIKSIEVMDEGVYKYKITTKGYNFFTDKLFQVGDTLLIQVYHKNGK